MTIAAIWLEDDLLWCAADTRLTRGEKDITTSEITAKIYTIPLAISACDPMLINAAATERRQPHYRTQYGFVYAGSALSASQTAITSSTMLQNLVRPGELWSPPRFEEIGSFMRRLALRFMLDRDTFGADGIFQAAFFGWCPYDSKYKVAHIAGSNENGFVKVDLSYPDPPSIKTEPWLVLGSGKKKFAETLECYRKHENNITKRIPRRVIDLMVTEGKDKTVGGATSIGVAYRGGFELCFAAEPVVGGQSPARRTFNGLDMDTEVGNVGDYFVSAIGVA